MLLPPAIKCSNMCVVVWPRETCLGLRVHGFYLVLVIEVLSAGVANHKNQNSRRQASVHHQSIFCTVNLGKLAQQYSNHVGKM